MARCGWLSFAWLALLAGQAHSFMQPVESGSFISVALGKQYVPVRKNNRTVAYKTAYFGTIYAGYPVAQNFTVVFDTGSGHFILPSSACVAPACMLHRRYRRELSSSGVDVEHDGTPIKPGATERDQVEIAFGTGEVTGEVVSEIACLQEPTQQVANVATGEKVSPIAAGCVRLQVVLATEMTSDPFSSFSFDGVLGLGLDSLVLSPKFSFFGQMTKSSRLAPIFSVYLAHGENAASEITFGGHNPRRLAPGTALSWAPVANPELGYWQVKLKSISIGDKKLDFCDDGSCRAILDTGTSLLGVPKQISKEVHWSLARVVNLADHPGELDCRTIPGPPVVFDFGDFQVELDKEDYSRPAVARMRPEGANYTEIFCRASLLPVDMQEPLGSKVFILGEPVLRRYYTAYDWGKKRVGFGQATHDHSSEPSSPCESGAGEGCLMDKKPTPSLLSQAQAETVTKGDPSVVSV